MDSFDALRRREEKPQNFGEFRTKRLILELYDAMAEATRTGEAYRTILDPPPGQGPRQPADPSERRSSRGRSAGAVRALHLGRVGVLQDADGPAAARSD